MKANPSPKFKIVGLINDDTLVFGIPYKRFTAAIGKSFSKQFEKIEEMKKSYEKQK